MKDLLKYGKKYSNLVVLSAGSKAFKKCEEFAKYYPDRYFSFGLGEGNMVSVAAGMAMSGKMPVVVGDRLMERAHDQIKSDVVAAGLNVKFIGVEDELKGEMFEEYGPGGL